MANLILPRRFRQPNGDVQVDQAFSKRCTFAFNAGSGPIDLVNRAAPMAPGSGVSWSGGAAGRALYFDGTQTNKAFSWGNYFNPFAGSRGLTVVAAINYGTGSGRVLAKWGISPSTFLCSIGDGSAPGELALAIGTGLYGVEAYRSSGLPITTNKDTAIVFKWDGNNGASGYSFFVDGTKAPSVTLLYDNDDPTTVPSNSGIGYFQIGISDDGAAALGKVYTVYGFNGGLTDTECIALSRNPWQLFKTARRVLYFDVGVGGGAQIPTLSDATVIDVTSTTATPQVALTF